MGRRPVARCFRSASGAADIAGNAARQREILTAERRDNIFDMTEWSIVIAANAVEREIRDLSPGHQADFLRIGAGSGNAACPFAWRQAVGNAAAGRGRDCAGDLLHNRRPADRGAACFRQADAKDAEAVARSGEAADAGVFER